MVAKVASVAKEQRAKIKDNADVASRCKKTVCPLASSRRNISFNRSTRRTKLCYPKRGNENEVHVPQE